MRDILLNIILSGVVIMIVLNAIFVVYYSRCIGAINDCLCLLDCRLHNLSNHICDVHDHTIDLNKRLKTAQSVAAAVATESMVNKFRLFAIADDLKKLKEILK